MKRNVRHWINRVDRKLALYGVLFAIIIFSAPYFTGYLVAAKFQDVTKVVSEFEPIKVNVLEYHRGWLKSYAKTQVTFQGRYAKKFLKAIENMEGLQNPQFDIILDHDIHHGPFVYLKENGKTNWLFALAAIQSKLHLTEENKKILVAEIGESELLQLNSEISIKGSVHATIVGRSLKLKQPDGTEHVVWKGINSEWDLTRDLKRFQGDVMVPGFDLNWQQSRYQGDDLRFKTERFKTPEGLWLGQGVLSIKSLSTVDIETNQINLALAGLIYSAMVNKEAEMMGIASNLRMDLFKYGAHQYGPINISGALKNMDWHVAKALVEIMHNLQMGDQSQQAAYLSSLVRLLPDLLKTRPEFNIEDLTIHAEQGDIKGALSFAIGGPNVHDDQSQIFQSIAAKVNFTLPKPLLVHVLTHQYTNNYIAYNELARQMGRTVLTDANIAVEVTKKVNETILTQLKQGFLVEKGNNYILAAELQQGKLTVNGNSVTSITAPIAPTPVLPPPTNVMPAAPPPSVKPEMPAAPPSPTAIEAPKK